MVELWIIIVMLCLLTATGSALLALRLQYRSLDSTRQEREAWQQAQEGRQRTWEVRQGKHILDAEKKLADQLKGTRREWRDWSVQLQQEHQEWRADVDLEKELTRLPHIEHIELTHQTLNGRLQPKDWHPPMFYKADLAGRDLSYRYLERADLRETNLRTANFYMTDLTGASLTGANLEQASLIGANLSGADLRGANLSGVNLLVADLHNAILHGTNLTGARNLTTAQLQTAIYDSTTIIDSSIDITLPRLPSVQITPPTLLTAAAIETQITSVPSTDFTESQAPISSADIFVSTSAENTDSIVNTPVTGETETPETVEISKTVLLVTSLINESTTLAPDAEVSLSAETPISSIDTTSEQPDPVSETSKKNSSTRQRTRKTKQAAASTASRQEETNASIPDQNQESDALEEDEEPEEEEIFPNKIIQWPTRAPKTAPLPNPTLQSKGDKLQKKQSNSRTANVNHASHDAGDQHAQAN